MSIKHTARAYIGRERDIHAGAPGEDFVLITSDFEATAMFFETNHGHVRKPFLTYRLHYRLGHFWYSQVTAAICQRPYSPSNIWLVCMYMYVCITITKCIKEEDILWRGRERRLGFNSFLADWILFV